jgi:putative membrane protein
MKKGYQFTVYQSGPGGHGGVNSTGTAGLFIKWLLLTAAVMITSYLFDSITVTGFFSALFAAAVIGMLNMLLRPILIILTLPVNLMTFGLFTFLMLKMASGLISGFTVTGFWSTVFGAIVISIVNWILNVFLLTFIQTRDRGDSPGNPGEIELKNRGGRWE